MWALCENNGWIAFGQEEIGTEIIQTINLKVVNYVCIMWNTNKVFFLANGEWHDQEERANGQDKINY